MTSPKYYKFIKIFKRTSSNQQKKFILSKNVFIGLISLEYGILTIQKYDLIKKVLSRKLNKRCKIFFKLSLNRSLTKKGSKSRMGKGIGEICMWYAYVHPGTLIVELIAYDVLNCNSLVNTISNLNEKLTFKCCLRLISYQFNFSYICLYPVGLFTQSRNE